MQNNIYIIASVVVFICGIILTQYIKIQHLNTDISNLRTALAYSEVSLTKLEESNRELNRSILVQNDAIELMAINKSKIDAEYAEWKAKPAKVRYEVIYKMREVKSDDCEDIKSVLDSSKSIDFNSL